jgi:hypothetical protein
VNLGLEPGTQLHQLGPIAHQFAQLAQRRRGDPRLRQAAEAQHVGQVGGVDDVVLDPPLSPLFNAFGFARCTVAPNSCNTSTAQYQPYVASNTTWG